MSKKKAAVYCRYSSTNQREESITTQLEAIQKYCLVNDIEIVATYIDEAQSATSDNRESFLQMIDDAKTGEWNTLVLYSLDRFSRSAHLHYKYQNILDSYGVNIIAIMDGLSTENNSPDAGLLMSLKVGLSEFYSRRLQVLVLDGCLTTCRNKEKPGGRVCLGYYSINKKYYIQEDEAKIIRLIFKMFNEGKQYLQIANYLNEQGYTTKNGYKFTVSGLEYIIRNKIYCGYLVYNRHKRKARLSDRKTQRILKPKEEHIIIPNVFPAIIDEDTFEKAQSIIRRRKEGRLKGEIYTKYLLSGLIHCKCGAKFNHMIKYGGTHYKRREIYNCLNGKLKKCKVKEINGKYLEDYVLLQLDRLLLVPNAKPKLEKLIVGLIADNRKGIKKQIDTLEKQNIKEDYEIAKYLEIAENANEVAQKALLSEVALRKAKIKDRVNKITELSKMLQNVSSDYVISIDEMMIKYYEARKGNFDELKKCVFKLINKIYMSNEEIQIFIDLTNFISGYKEDLFYKIKVERDKVAYNRFSRKL